jgi:methylated-DNA-protein-cysteine methyltransferase-like protein
MMSLKNRQNNIYSDSFFERVYQVVKQVPEGRVTTYGAVARCIGSSGAARMVGWALNNCHNFSDFIPAHRVVNRVGMLTGKNHFRHPDMMQQLLEAEGIKVVKDQVDDFAQKFWDPCNNLI